MLRIGLAVRQRIECDCCDGNAGSGDPEDHEPSCPRKGLQDYVSSRPYYKCPECYRGTVALNKEDYWECRHCRTQFTASEIAGGENPDELKQTFFLGETNFVPVLVMKAKGTGNFADDKVIAHYHARIREARKIKKARRS
jgi:hypothetical protein